MNNTDRYLLANPPRTIKIIRDKLEVLENLLKIKTAELVDSHKHNRALVEFKDMVNYHTGRIEGEIDGMLNTYQKSKDHSLSESTRVVIANILTSCAEKAIEIYKDGVDSNKANKYNALTEQVKWLETIIAMLKPFAEEITVTIHASQRDVLDMLTELSGP